MTAVCDAPHTRFQPNNEEFKCPKCKALAGDFYIACPADGADEDCELLHMEDDLECLKCGYGASGKSWALRTARQMNLVTCPTCKGKGKVKGPT